ncbi:MAG: choline dehydrogenase [Actinomycetota bacterium]|jgi:choline dehydrogenase|nr:choline dehydrogenase [Actinomycetota bacterium]
MYDVVVIGAGSAGAVVAARASEHPGLDVLLLEAGPDYEVVASTPFDLVNSNDNSYVDHDWGYSYTPVAGGRTTPFPRGRVTGGSSAVNTAIALRGMPEDYDHWASLGCPEWAWSSVLPAFCRLERDLDFGSAPYHGDAGPITIRRYRDDEMTEPQAAFLETAAALGYPFCEDANAPDSWGAGPHPMNKAGRVRVSTAIGYLAPARVRPNLTVRAMSPVDRLVVENGRVVAAEVDGERIEGKLFVLSAGAIASPALLLRSGLSMPGVGENLADHPASMVVGTLRAGIELDVDAPLMQTILRYTCEGSSLRNDLQIEQLSFFGGRGGRPVGIGIAAVVEATFSRGTVRLDDDGSSVVIDANLNDDPRDVDRLAHAFLDSVKFFQTKPLADLVEDITFPRLPVDLDSARSLVRQYCGSGYHPGGTIRMGAADDPSAVVDQYGRARGVDGLVVADASIMPTVPRANTNLTCIMIGEMIGEWLRTSPSRYGL